MPERTTDTEKWTSDEWYQELSITQRYLFDYLWTNDHCRAGLYYLTLNTMSNETKIPKDDLPDLLRSLAPKVIWYQEENLIWVKNFIKRQMKSPDFLRGAAKSLLAIRNENVIQELLKYNKERYGLHIPYEEYKAKGTKKVVAPPQDSSEEEEKHQVKVEFEEVTDFKPDPVAEEIWSKALAELEGKVTKPNFQTFLEKTRAISYKKDVFVIGVSNTFTAEYLENNQRSLIEKTLIELTKPGVKVIFKVIKGKGDA